MVHFQTGATTARTQQKLAQLCSAFYTYIPHAFGRKKAPLLTLADIQVSVFDDTQKPGYCLDVSVPG